MNQPILAVIISIMGIAIATVIGILVTAKLTRTKLQAPEKRVGEKDDFEVEAAGTDGEPNNIHSEI